MIELDVQSSKKGHGRESLQSLLVLLYSCSTIVIFVIYAITHTDYTQYINTHNCGQACPHDACSICLLIDLFSIGDGILMKNK